MKQSEPWSDFKLIPKSALWQLTSRHSKKSSMLAHEAKCATRTPNCVQKSHRDTITSIREQPRHCQPNGHCGFDNSAASLQRTDMYLNTEPPQNPIEAHRYHCEHHFPPQVLFHCQKIFNLPQILHHHCKFYFTAESFYLLLGVQFYHHQFYVVHPSFSFTPRLWFFFSEWFYLNFIAAKFVSLWLPIAKGLADYYIPGIILGISSANERRAEDDAILSYITL